MNFRFQKPTGNVSARIHGARKTLQQRANSAHERSLSASDEREAASFRGKAKAYYEADLILEAIELGHKLPWKRKDN